jgi:hypothetical protein
MNNPTIKPLKYQSELMRLTNLKTGNKRYYVSICDVMTRVSYEDYLQRYDSADGFSSYHTTETKTHKREYITAVYGCGEML